MRIFVTLLFLSISLYATEYYAKAEPKELFHIKSSVNGQVTYVDVKSEGRVSTGEIVVKIDDIIDTADLKASNIKLKYLESNINLMYQNLKNSKKVSAINSNNYERVKNLSSYSKVQKDTKLLAMINAQNSYISVKTALENLKTQKEDLQLKIASLKDKIQKKNIKVKEGNYIYKIYPRKGDYLNPGSPIIDVYDISGARLVIYLSLDEIEALADEKIYLDGKESDATIDKIWKVADSVNISSYRVEILIDKPKQFSKLVKIEFR